MENVLSFHVVKMVDTSKDRLLLGRGVHHFTTTSLFTRGVNKFLLAYVIFFKHVRFLGNISPACAKEYLTAATYNPYYCQVEVKVCDRIAVVISEIIGRSGCHFSACLL